MWSCLLAATLCVAYCTALVARHSLSLATIKPSPRQSSTTTTDSMSASELKCAVFCHVYPDTAVFSSRPRSEDWPHYGHTFSIYLCPLSFWLTLPRRVLSTYNTARIIHSRVCVMVRCLSVCPSICLSHDLATTHHYGGFAAGQVILISCCSSSLLFVCLSNFTLAVCIFFHIRPLGHKNLFSGPWVDRKLP